MTEETINGLALRLEWPAARIAVVTFIREKQLNSLSLELLNELRRALEICNHSRAAALILIGAGPAFCAGAHLDLFLDVAQPIGVTPEDWRNRYLKPMADLFDGFEAADCVVIAAINGFALGGGAEMALSADYRLMSRTAKFGLPETKLGAIPGAGGVQKLIRHVGRAKALEWILLGSHVDAAQLERAGLLYAITEPADLLPASLALAHSIAGLSPTAVAQAKRAIYMAEDADLKSAQLYGLDALTALMYQPEWREGVEAFLSKRAPDFLSARDNATAALPGIGQ